MPDSNIKKLRVAAIQMVCEAGKVEANLKHGGTLIHQAVQEGAELVLLPELMPSGYMATEDIWDCAEAMEGKSVSWLTSTAKKHGIYLGFTFLEAEGEDFYNAFVLATPTGDIAGRVRKSPPASIEANFYKEGNDPHVIETDIGRIGVSICYENLLYEQICELAELNVDFMLCPSAAGRPKAILPNDVQRFESMLREWRSLYGDVLGVPALMANRVGILETELPGMLPYLKSSFPGLSFIANADGLLLSELGDEEGIIVENIELNPSKKRSAAPKRYGKMWAKPVPWYSFIWPMTQKTGEKAYKKNSRRPLKALSISQR